MAYARNEILEASAYKTSLAYENTYCGILSSYNSWLQSGHSPLLSWLYGASDDFSPRRGGDAEVYSQNFSCGALQNPPDHSSF